MKVHQAPVVTWQGTGVRGQIHTVLHNSCHHLLSRPAVGSCQDVPCPGPCSCLIFYILVSLLHPHPPRPALALVSGKLKIGAPGNGGGAGSTLECQPGPEFPGISLSSTHGHGLDPSAQAQVGIQDRLKHVALEVLPGTDICGSAQGVMGDSTLAKVVSRCPCTHPGREPSTSGLCGLRFQSSLQ